MRTATPISTCSRITLRAGSSATALSISTPRFIGPGCMTMRVRRGAGQLLRGRGRRSGRYSRERGHQAAGHPLLLQAQHHHHVGAVEPRLHVVEDLDAQPVGLGRDQGRRADQPHAAPIAVQQEDVGARHPAVQHVAADRDRQPLEPALAAADGERVEQRLGRVLMRAVAGVDDRGRSTFCDSSAGRAATGRGGPPAGRNAWRSGSPPCRSGSRPCSRCEVATDMLMTSAPSRLPASSKLVRVRVSPRRTG